MTEKDIQNGLSEFRSLMEQYHRSLDDKDPELYLERTATGEQELPKNLLQKINRILTGKTLEAQNSLTNRFRVLNEANRQEIKIRYLRDKREQLLEKFEQLARYHANSRVGDIEMDGFFRDLKPYFDPEKIHGLKRRWEMIKTESAKRKGYDLALSAVDSGLSAKEAIHRGQEYIAQRDRQDFEQDITQAAKQAELDRDDALEDEVDSLLGLPDEEFLAEWKDTRKKISERQNISKNAKNKALQLGDSRIKSINRKEQE